MSNVPEVESWRRAAYNAEECLAGCLASPEIATRLDQATVRTILERLSQARMEMLAASEATQPAAGEPVAPIGYANPKHLARMAAGEMGSVSVLAERSPDENHTAPVFGTPLAAAHG